MRWRIGILYRVIELLELLRERPVAKSGMLASFASTRFRNVSIDDVLDTCVYAGWAELGEDSQISCTDDGRRLLGLGNAQARLRDQIQCLLNREDPLWASSAVQGRQALASYAPPEVVQCFREAGLLAGDDADVVAWWDELACRYRAAQDEVYVEIGRRGEKLTVELETRRTRRAPQWIALEYSNAGYDVLSCLSPDDPKRLVIEVKTSVQPWNRADFYLSRAEWDILSIEDNAVIHLWSVFASPPQHSSIPLVNVRPHIPADSGDGCWHRCRIPFEAFAPQVTQDLLSREVQ